MALTPIKVPTRSAGVPITDGNLPTGEFIRWLNNVLQQISAAVNATTEAINAANAAQQAADTAQASAETAQAAADQAATDVGVTARETALNNSYIDPNSVLTASPTTITVAAHTRRYADGTSVSVAAGSIPATASGDVDYVFYVDPTRAGGAVNYQVSTDQPAQTGDTHVVGAVTIPATGTVPGGRGPRVPGAVEP